MLGFATWAEARLESADVASITALFALLVLLAATQVGPPLLCCCLPPQVVGGGVVLLRQGRACQRR